MKPIIKLENVKYSYNKNKDVLTNINLEIFPGEDIAIIGHNGSGKSTLGKLLIGLLHPREGTLYFNELPINNSNENIIRAKTGIVFQNPDNQFVGVTVADDIAFGLENKNIPSSDMQKIIEDFSEKLGVKELLNKAPENLSGGQKQRVAIAGILAMLPDVIIFDEAFAMLDPQGKNEINLLLKKIKSENQNLTIIKITHDLEEAFDSNRVIVLDDGAIVLDDTPVNVFLNEKIVTLKIERPFIVELNKRLLEEKIIGEPIFSFELLGEKLCK